MTTRPASKTMHELVALAWRAFDRALKLPSCVKSSVPILFFGDYQKYQSAMTRILTVGLNPSLHEFPTDDPLKRFSLLKGNLPRDPKLYLRSMSRYFYDEPYRKWFDSLETLLNGADASYFPNEASSTALHTDICSPVATDPTWSNLPAEEQAGLMNYGKDIWIKLIAELRPQIVIVSVAQSHIERIGLGSIKSWEVIHRFEKKADGSPRKKPYEVRANWPKLFDQQIMFIFGQAAQYPFGTLAKSFKQELGKIAITTFQNRGRNHDK